MSKTNLRRAGYPLILLFVYLLGVQYFHLETSLTCGFFYAIVAGTFIWWYELRSYRE